VTLPEYGAIGVSILLDALWAAQHLLFFDSDRASVRQLNRT
jgi:hypothetical protein